MVFITIALKYGDVSKERNKTIIVALITLVSSIYAALIHIPKIVDNDESYELIETHTLIEQDEYLVFNGRTISLYIEDDNDKKELILNTDKVEFKKTEEVFSVDKYENRFSSERYVISVPEERWSTIENK